MKIGEPYRRMKMTDFGINLVFRSPVKTWHLRWRRKDSPPSLALFREVNKVRRHQLPCLTL